MVARALDAGVPCGWVLGDAVHGADRRPRMMLEGRGQPYLLGVRGNDTVWALDLARVAGRRWLVEDCFEAAKQEVGLADHEVRSWRGWHRHVTLAMLALALLAGLRARLNAAKGGGSPPVRPSSPSACLSFAA